MAKIKYVEALVYRRERRQYQIPSSLYKKGNELFLIPFQKLYGPAHISPRLQKILPVYPFDTAKDSLVLCIPLIRQESMPILACDVMHALLQLNNRHQANHTLDWWYRPIIVGHGLIAIRLNGLYELAMGEE